MKRRGRKLVRRLVTALRPFAGLTIPQRARKSYPLVLDPLGETIRVGHVRRARATLAKAKGVRA